MENIKYPHYHIKSGSPLKNLLEFELYLIFSNFFEWLSTSSKMSRFCVNKYLESFNFDWDVPIIFMFLFVIFIVNIFEIVISLLFSLISFQNIIILLTQWSENVVSCTHKIFPRDDNIDALLKNDRKKLFLQITPETFSTLWLTQTLKVKG